MSRLVFLYGPPASGKLTIGKMLAQEIGGTLFSNQETNDYVQKYFPFGHESFYRLVDTIRLLVIQELLSTDQDVVFTFVYSGSSGDNSFIQRLLQIINQTLAQVRFVKLTCPVVELLKRVINPSRAHTRKIRDQTSLKTLLLKYDFFLPIGFVDSLEIDTSEMLPREATQRICLALGLNSS